jgi:hypothetical protein
LIAGHVVDAEERRNAVTGEPFWWALVETIGGYLARGLSEFLPQKESQ